MPTYEYECTACAHRFEAFQAITAAPLKRCPKCRRKVRRVPGPGAGVIFKGSGFYVTDYRSPSYKEAAKKESGSAAKPEGGKKAPAASAAPKPAKSDAS